ncbi:hypothetical protein A3860_31515 [Niastella vici]|uniref:Uncharacterized protein n=1 Tax=Niastella vici TaxID=1703345 RepID=A0A1V9FTY4_9BACT|nr:hypothetical protein [Niastella vici]OQP61790.1 hypothetical protein A3860_31515 [Niastella vici]
MITGANIEQQVYDYVDNSDNCELVTRNGIIIESLDDNSLQAEYRFIDTEDTRLSVVLYAEKKKFVETLNIRRMGDIDALTPGDLIEVYDKGLAEMACFITLHYSYCLVFQKTGNDIVATNESDCQHMVPVSQKLETHDQFIAYTEQYYKLLEASEN